MTTYAFTDGKEGYYQVDVPEGGPFPAWTEGLIPCDVQPPAPPAQVTVATPRQFRLALNQLGLRAAVEAAVASADQDTKDTWEFATTVERTNPQLCAMASSLGLTEDQLDGLFTLAATK